MIKIINLEKQTIPSNVVFPQLSLPHQWFEYSDIKNEDIIHIANDADVILVNKLQISKEIIYSLPNLKLICVMATGYNNIDTQACKERGIAVSNLQKYGTDSVAEHTIGLILSLARNIPLYSERVKDCTWSKSKIFCLMNYNIYDLKGKTLGIIGKGAIGQRLGEIAKNAFGMNVIFADRKISVAKREDKTDFIETIKQSDFISIHCPLTTDTKDLITLKEISVMKNNVCLINVSRGGIINEQDLAKALQDHLIAGAAVDVVNEEPIADNHVLLSLLGKYNFIITPHIAWLGDTALANVGHQIIENIEAFFNGKLIRRIV